MLIPRDLSRTAAFVRSHKWLIGIVSVLTTVFVVSNILLLIWYSDAIALNANLVERQLTEETVILALLATALGFLAFLAAIVAVTIAWPPYMEWLAEKQTPEVLIGWQAFQATEGEPKLLAQVDWREAHQSPLLECFNFSQQTIFPDIYFRAIIHNRGPATVKSAILNIIVPTTTELRPFEPEQGHYLGLLPARDCEIKPETWTTVRFTRAERDFPPGQHYFYTVGISFPRDSQTTCSPILVALDGDPKVSIRQRVFALRRESL